MKTPLEEEYTSLSQGKPKFNFQLKLSFNFWRLHFIFARKRYYLWFCLFYTIIRNWTYLCEANITADDLYQWAPPSLYFTSWNDKEDSEDADTSSGALGNLARSDTDVDWLVLWAEASSCFDTENRGNKNCFTKDNTKLGIANFVMNNKSTVTW